MDGRSTADISSMQAPHCRSKYSLPADKKSFRPAIGRKHTLVSTTCYIILELLFSLIYAVLFLSSELFSSHMVSSNAGSASALTLSCIHASSVCVGGCGSGVIFGNILLIPGSHPSRLAGMFGYDLLSPSSPLLLKFIQR